MGQTNMTHGKRPMWWDGTGQA